MIIIFITFSGFLLLKGFGVFQKASDTELLPYSFALGTGLIGIQMYLYSSIGLPWSIFLLLLPWFILNTIAVLKNKKIFSFKIKKIFLTKQETAILILILSLLVFVGVESVIRPLSAWDGWAIWLIKAKMFFNDGTINPASLIDLESGYPLLISLVATFFYVLYGQVDDQSVLLFFYSFYFFLGISFFFALKKKFSTIFSLLMTFLLLSTQNLIRHGGRYEAGQADLALAFYIFISALLVVQYAKRMEGKTLFLLNLLLVFTSLVKNEGLAFTVLVQILIMAIMLKTRSYKHILFSLIWIIPVIEWQMFKNTFELTQLYHFVGAQIHFDRIVLIIHEFVREFFNIQRWNLLWVTFVFILIAFPKKIVQNALLYFILIVGQLFIYAGIYFITPVDPVAQIRSSVDRLIMHIAPLAFFVSSLVIGEVVKTSGWFTEFFKTRK